MSQPSSKAKSLLARAKLNLFLQVVGRRADGYHLLDSLVAFASTADLVTAQPAERLSLSVSGPFAQHAGPDNENLVLRAARALQTATGCIQGAALFVEKNIPAGAGLGGGSSDAAMTLRVLNEIWELDLSLNGLAKIALTLGADVPVCVYAQAAHMSGIGENVLPIDPLPAIDMVLVHPGQSLATPAVFKALAGRYSGQARPLPANISAPSALMELLNQTTNDLEAPARELLPAIDQILESLRSRPGCVLARMSGSGSACFGLFADSNAASAAAGHIQQTQPQWWVQSGKLEQA